MSERKYSLIVIALTLVATFFSVANIIPSARTGLREIFKKSDRTVLAKVESDFANSGETYVVAKVKTADILSLEVFKKIGSQIEFEPIQKIDLNEKRDAYFNFHGHQTNLAIADVDQDGEFEVIVPTFDENLIPRLNLFKFDKNTKSFFKLKADQIGL